MVTGSGRVHRLAWTRAAAVLALLGMGPPPALAQQPAPGPPPTVQAAPDTSDYRLRAGDEIEVRMYFHPDLTQQFPIRPDGGFSFPLIGEVRAEGLTPAELARTLSERLGTQLQNPDVAVVVRRFSGLRIYVGGEVGAPGAYDLTPPLSSLQAILRAGGFTRRGRKGSVMLVRNEGGTPSVTRLDLSDAEVGDITSQTDILLRPLDIIYVPPTRIASVNDFVEQYITNLVPATVILGLNYNFGRFGTVGVR